MLKKILFIILVVCMSSNLYAEDKQSSSKRLDIDCLKEILGASKKLNNDNVYNKCTKSLHNHENNMRKFSSVCQKEFESQKRMTTVICKQEQANLAVAAGMELYNCAQKSYPISFKCSEQLKSDLERTQERVKHCADAVNKTSTICGDDIEVNMKCFEKHRAELVAACGETLDMRWSEWIDNLGPGRFAANAETRSLCKKDGGLHVYQKINLQPGRFPTIIPDEGESFLFPHGGTIYGKYRYKQSTSTTKSHGYDIYRTREAITSLEDGGLIGEVVSYVRRGEPEAPGLSCPESGEVGEDKLIDSVFVQEGEKVDPYPPCPTGTPEVIHFDGSFHIMKEHVRPDKRREKTRGTNCDERTRIYGRTQLLFFGKDGKRCSSPAMPDADQIICREDGIMVFGFKGKGGTATFLMQTFALTGGLIREVEIADVAPERGVIVSYQESETAIDVRTAVFQNHKDTCYAASASKKPTTTATSLKRIGPPDITFRAIECGIK